MQNDQLNENQPTNRPRRGVKLAVAGVLVGAVLATSGIAHAGYRWKRMAPPTTQTTTTVKPAPTTTAFDPGASTEGYRWR